MRPRTTLNGNTQRGSSAARVLLFSVNYYFPAQFFLTVSMFFCNTGERVGGRRETQESDVLQETDEESRAPLQTGQLVSAIPNPVQGGTAGVCSVRSRRPPSTSLFNV